VSYRSVKTRWRIVGIDWPQQLWGDVPNGFKRISLDRRRVVMVRDGFERYLCQENFLGQPEPGKGLVLYGREKLDRISLNGGQTALVRTYRHGGLVRHLTGYFFFSWPPRPFKELAVTEEARQRGISTLEVLGARVERVWGPVYRGWLVTRELEESEHFWDALRNGRYGNGDRLPLLRSVAECICRMHRRGLFHSDLNLKNILVRREAGAIKSYVIDLDKAKLFPREVPRGRARKNLHRLLCSVRKLDPSRRYFSLEDWERFVGFYAEAGCR